ncbi:response regulator transcription factor [Candidatus Roizmanbacteria bacterium]|nr:response regulator transcription factor [Candidatus Roizmanbacteria bacterium]
MAKSQKKLVARKQRREGKSIKEIAKNLDVSPGSVSVWVRDIFLTENQIKNLQKRRTDAYFGKKAEYIKKRLKRTENKINILRNKGIKEVGRLTKREIFLTNFKGNCEYLLHRKN